VIHTHLNKLQGTKRYPANVPIDLFDFRIDLDEELKDEDEVRLSNRKRTME
jgi:hypothetical protein